MNQQSTNRAENESPDDVLQQAIASVERETVPIGPPPALIAATLHALEASGQAPQGPLLLMPRATIVKLAATAAGLLIVTCVVLLLFSAIESPSPAFADVFGEALAQVRQPQSMSYLQQVTIEGKRQPITTKEFVAADGRRRSEIAGHTTIFDATGHTRLTLIEPTHTALVREAKEDPGLNPGKTFLDWLQRLKELGDKPDKELGQKELNGKQVTGFVATQDNRAFTMWIDDATGEPVRIEYDSQVGGGPAHITMSDFHLHQTLDESLFSFEVPMGFEAYGRPEDGKIEPSAGLELAWSRDGDWSGVASAIGRPAVFGLQHGGRAIELNDADKEIATTEVDDGSGSIRAAGLLGDQTSQLLTFRSWGPAVDAYDVEGKLLWSYAQERGAEETWGVDDVWPADLDGDGMDEVIIGYSGATGLHVLDRNGHLLWKNTTRGNIWHVTAGDVDGDARPEVLTTSSAGTVRVFGAEGKHLRDIDPGFYAQLVRFWQPKEVADRRIEASVASRNALLQLVREQELQILLLKERKAKGANAAAPPTEPLIEDEFAKDPQIADLVAQLANLKLAIDEKLSQETHVGTGALRRKLAALEELIQERKKELQPEVMARLTGNHLDPLLASGADIDAMLPLLEFERNVLNSYLDMANEDLNKQIQEFDKLDTDTADMESREAQLEGLRTIIKRISYQLDLWNVELEAEQRIKWLDKASRPSGYHARMKYLATGIALIAGFCLSLLVSRGIARLRSQTSHSRALSIGFGLLVGGLSGAVAYVFVPVRYEAEALIRVNKVTPVVIQDVQNSAGGDELSYDLFKKTQRELLKSNFVLSRAARKSEMLDLDTMKEHKEDPVGFLESKLIVDYPGDAELMRVSMKGTRRNELPIIVNSIVEAYMDEIVFGDKVARLNQKDILFKQNSKNKEVFRQKSDEFKALARQLGASSSESARVKKRLADKRLDSLVASRDALMQRIRDQDLQILLLKERKAKGSDGLSTAAAGRLEAEYMKDPVIADLMKKATDVRLALKEQQGQFAGSGHFSVRNVKRQLAQLQQQIEERKARLQPEIVKRLNGKAIDRPPTPGGDIDAMLPLMEAERDELQKELAAANKDLDVQLRDTDKSASLILVAGSAQRKVPLAALDSQGKTQWSLELSSPVANAVTSVDRPWLAVSLRDGNVRVVDLTAGKEIAHVGGQGGAADVAWLPVEGGSPLLVVTTEGKLQAYRIVTDTP